MKHPAALSMLFAICLAACSHAPTGSSGSACQLPPSLAPAPSTPIDAATGLPLRVIHRESGVEFVLIPAGQFTMGDPADTGRERQHRRVIRRPFYMGRTEVTIAQYRRFVDSTGYVTDAERGAPEEPDKTVGAFAQISTFHQRQFDARAQWRNPFPLLPAHQVHEDHPVSQVSWNDAMAFCKHYGFSLPSDAQWEYACRAGASTLPAPSNIADLSTRRLFNDESATNSFDDGYATLSPAGAFAPNEWGLCDMAGNLEEWTAGPFDIAPPRDGDDESVPPAKSHPENKTLRGTSWITGPNADPFIARFSMRQFSRRDFIGFRVCLPVASGNHGEAPR